ncbi:TetR/AcrR family transcriptional regulator [Paenibacillus puldeungensis]|uniref:TetR/AcrR family transcriptional regulator n=1 Tax=Paenibacillus puldeungensis TaxID=696536 RepID=A0ABW3S4I0_9BACL
MSTPSQEKKKIILRTAMQLFAAKGASATSMQELAEACGMSKGSLYLHFKSKEELELSLFDYCYQMLLDQLMQADLKTDLTPKQKMCRQLEIMLELVLELREFLLMQFRDWLKNGIFFPEPEAVKAYNIKLLSYAKDLLEAVYGPGIKPYVNDLIIIAYGMIGMYIRLLFDPSLHIKTSQIAAHLVHLLDISADSLLRTKPEPLLPENLLETFVKAGHCETQQGRHPLLAIRDLKESLDPLISDKVARQHALESLQILEEEILELRPRRAILQGMLANLSANHELKPKLTELDQLLQAYFQRLP